jgi:hypothetical protein
LMQKKKRKGTEEEAGDVAAQRNGHQPQAGHLESEPTQVSAMACGSTKKKAKSKSVGSLGGRRTSDMMRLLVS